jgi:hypothetical protein
VTDLGQALPCKLGTVPAVIYALDRRTPLEVGRIVRIKERAGDRWSTVKVTRVDPCGYFMADRI